MINILEFEMSNEYKYSWNLSARTFFRLFYQLPECMLLYRYHIAEGFIFSKFGCNHPDKIDFEKLYCKNLILFHLDVYKEKTEKLKELIDWTIENKIDIWIPYHDPDKLVWSEGHPHYKRIKSIWQNYSHNVWSFNGISLGRDSDNKFEELVSPKLKNILREVRLKNLLS